MEFKFRAIDNINPSTMQPSLPTVTYLPDRSLPMDGGFSGSRVPLATNEAALRREIEKEQIRRDMLRRMELEEEVRSELAMEGAFGTMQRPLNSLWSNSTPRMMNPVAVDDHMGASQPPEIKHFPQTRDKDKVILLAKPDLGLDSAKRKAVTHDIVLEDEPSAIGLNKKLKKEWSCELCQIKASSENGLNDHLNGKKHKARELRQKSEKTAKNATDAVVNTTISRVDAESKTEEQHVETMAGNGLNVTESKTEEKLIDTMVDKSVVESKNEEQLVEMVAENGVSVTESNNEKLEEMMVDKRVTESKNEEQHMEKNENVDSFESIKGAATEEVGRKSALTETMKVGGLWCEVCQIGTTSQVVMEEHIKGKKHIKKMKMFNQKCLSSTSFVS